MIAAAPDLLEAAQAARKALAGRLYPGGGDFLDLSDLTGPYQLLDEAIRKAIG